MTEHIRHWVGPTAVHKAQVKTFTVARELTGEFSDVTQGLASYRRPFSLRVVRKYRDQDAQDFRNEVAAEVRRRRKEGLL